MGSDDHYPEEAPTHRVRVDAFAIDATAVTNAAVRALRRRHRLRDGGRAAARPGRLPRTRPPENLQPGSLVFTPTRGTGRPASPQPVVDAGRRARAGGTRRARAARSKRGPTTRSCTSPTRTPQAYADLGRAPPADRGRVGVRRPRRPRGRGLHLGRRGPARAAGSWPTPGTARTSPGAAPARAAGSRTSPVGQLPGQRLRALRHGRQRVGVDRRLVDRAATPTTPARRAARPANPRGGDVEHSYDPRPAAVPDRPQGDQGRLAPVRRHLLPALPARRPPPADDRHRHEPPRASGASAAPTPDDRRRP